MPSYTIPARQTRVELLIQKSRFIATAAPVFNVDDARHFIAKIKAEFSDATHNVSAYIIGFGQSVIAHSSDDGEPSGTAGRPVLTVLSNCGLGDIAIVVTRYFGGIKLGTGGLVRAYTESAQQVLAITPIAKKIPVQIVRLVLPYSSYNFAKVNIERHHGIIVNQQFSTDVSLLFEIPVEHFAEFRANIMREEHRTIRLQVQNFEEKIFPILK